MNKYTDEKILCEMYELFYWKEPDFDNESIVLEIHSMMRILWHFGIYLYSEGFSIDSTIEHFPFNDEIQWLIDNLKKVNQDNIQEVELKKKVIMKIQLISIALHSKAEECGYEFFDFAFSVSKIIHANEQVLPDKEGKEISKLEYIDYNENAIDSVLLLVKDIDKDIERNLQNIDEETSTQKN